MKYGRKIIRVQFFSYTIVFENVFNWLQNYAISKPSNFIICFADKRKQLFTTVFREPAVSEYFWQQKSTAQPQLVNLPT